MNLDNYYIIPLSSDPNQTMRVTIPVDGNNLDLTLGISYNSVGGYWWMSITKDNVMLIDGLPIEAADYPAADILSQYSYLRIGSAFLIKSGNIGSDQPGIANLGSDFLLIWGDTIV